MASVNKVIILGNCGRDPEVRYLPSGMAVANVSVATSSRRKDKNTGETVEEAQWHRVVFYDRLAEIVEEYVTKGKPIYIEGRLKYGKYTGQDGVERYTCDIVGTELQLLGGRDQGGAPTPAPPPASNSYAEARGRPAPPRSTGGGFDDMDDDIPF